MKLTKIPITFESEKISAIRMFNPDDSPNIEELLAEQLEKLYIKIVPPPVRKYIEVRGRKTTAANTSRKTKPV